MKAIPIAGQIAAVAMSCYDAIKGWQNADKIVGKSKDQVTATDKIAASGAEMLSGLTLGLVSAKTIHDVATSDAFVKAVVNTNPIFLGLKAARCNFNKRLSKRR